MNLEGSYLLFSLYNQHTYIVIGYSQFTYPILSSFKGYFVPISQTLSFEGTLESDTMGYQIDAFHNIPYST